MHPSELCGRISLYSFREFSISTVASIKVVNIDITELPLWTILDFFRAMCKGVTTHSEVRLWECLFYRRQLLFEASAHIMHSHLLVIILTSKG
jgi:hypothetical protein